MVIISVLSRRLNSLSESLQCTVPVWQVPKKGIADESLKSSFSAPSWLTRTVMVMACGQTQPNCTPANRSGKTAVHRMAWVISPRLFRGKDKSS